jgi:hypothetical protein
MTNPNRYIYGVVDDWRLGLVVHRQRITKETPMLFKLERGGVTYSSQIYKDDACLSVEEARARAIRLAEQRIETLEANLARGRDHLAQIPTAPLDWEEDR